MIKKLLSISLITTNILLSGCAEKPIKHSLPNKISSQISQIKQAQKSSVTTDSYNQSAKNIEPFYGVWTIKKAVGYCRIGTYGTSDIKKLVGKTLTFSKGKSSCFGDDASYLKQTIKKPIYKKSHVTSNQFYNDWFVSLNSLTIKNKTVTEIDVYDSTHDIACTFFIKNTNTLILYGGGTFFKLRRTMSTQTH